MVRIVLTFCAATLVGWFILAGSMSMLGHSVSGWALGLLVTLGAQTAIWAASDFFFAE